MPRMTRAKTPITCARVHESASGIRACARARASFYAGSSRWPCYACETASLFAGTACMCVSTQACVRVCGRACARLGQAHQQRRRHVMVLFEGDLQAPAHARRARRRVCTRRREHAQRNRVAPRPAGARMTPRALLSSHTRTSPLPDPVSGSARRAHAPGTCGLHHTGCGFWW